MSSAVPRKRRPSAKMRAFEGVVWMLRYGGFADGDRLPSERVLCERLDVSKTVLHPMMEVLAKSDVVETRHGSGTYLMPHRPLKVFQSNEAFSETVQSAGMEPGSVVIRFRREEADERIADLLDVAEGDPVWSVVRLRTADGRPIVAQRFWIPSEPYPDLEEWIYTEENVYATMRERYGCVFSHGRETVSVVEADARAAEALDVPVGVPVFFERSVDEGADGKPVVYSECMVRPDRFQFASVEVMPGFEGKLDLAWLSI